MFSIVDRYKLWNCAAFGSCDNDNGGGGSSSSSDKDDKPSGVGPGNTLPNGNTSLGSVSASGNYAGDGFEWQQNPNTNALTRVYTGANANAGLGTDVITGGTSDKNTKEVIANISLNEGTEFAASPGSATDHNIGSFLTTGDSGASASYADQVGATGFAPAVSYDSTQTGAANTALRDAKAAAEASAAALEKAKADLKAQQAALSLPVGGPGTFTPGALPAAPIEPVTPVSYGEAGRGGPDSAAPGNYTYQPGVDPELEMLVSLKNSGVDLDPNEYLKATAYENDKNASGSPTGGVQVADATGILSSLGKYATDIGKDVYNALTLQDDVTPALVDAGKSAFVGLPENLGDMSTGLGNYLTTTAPLSFAPQGTTNPLLLGLSEAYKFMMPDEQKQNLLFSADPNREPSPAAGALLDMGTYLGDTVAPAVESYLQPGNVGVFTGDTFENLNFVDATTGQQISGSDAVSGGLNLMGREGIADTGLDVALSMNPYTRAVSAALNAGEQLTGFATGISDTIDNAYVNGQLDNNPVFQKALEAQGGNVDNALAVMKDFAYTASGESGIPGYAQIAGSGAVDALIPGISKGNAFISAAKEGVKRAGVEGAQGAFESYAAISAVNNALGTDFDPTENIVGAAATEGLAGSSAGLVSPIFGQGLTANQRRGIQDSALGNEAAMQQAAGTQGVASFAPGPVNQTAVAPQPEAMTTAPTVFNPNLSKTAGELAASNVPTAYDIEQDKVAGLLEAPQGPDSSATSLDVMAAQEIIENQIRETGTISPEVMTNLQAATGLSMNDLSSMATNAATGTLGGQTFPINVGSETPSDLMDQPTGIGGGGNIGVETLPNGDTLLRNNETGRTTVVDKGENLANAIQVFDEVTTPFGAPEIDTTPVSLPPFNVAGAPAQPVLPAGTDTSPVMPSAPKAPNIPAPDVAGLGSLQPDSLPNVDTSSLPQGIVAAQDNNPNQPAPTGTTFTTARGSTYTVTENGTTVRNRAPDEEGGDFVQQPQSGKTIFMSNEDKQKFGSLFQQGEPGLYQFTPVAGTTDKAQLVFTKDYGPNKAGDTVPGTEITYSNTPESGESPVEIYNSTNDNPNNIHFGSEITQVGGEGDDGSVEVQVPATTDGDTLPATAGTEVVIGDDDSSNEVGGLEGEILGPEISTEVTPDQDTGVTIDMEVTPETDTSIGTETVVSLPPVGEETTPKTPVTPPVTVTPKPLIEVDVDEPPEEEPPVVTVDPPIEEPPIVLIPQITTTDKDGNTIKECPEGYQEVQTPDGIMCDKITTTSRTTGRRTYAVGPTATTGLAGNIGRQKPRSRTRTTTTTSRSRVNPINVA